MFPPLAYESHADTLLAFPCSYVGVMHMEFLQYCADLGVPVGPNLTTGNGMDFLIGRVSYSFGLTGPCVRCAVVCKMLYDLW